MFAGHVAAIVIKRSALNAVVVVIIIIITIFHRVLQTEEVRQTIDQLLLPVSVESMGKKKTFWDEFKVENSSMISNIEQISADIRVAHRFVSESRDQVERDGGNIPPKRYLWSRSV